MPQRALSRLGANPAALTWSRPENPLTAPGDPRCPIVATTFRLTEHHTAGAMSRNLPWLAELQPEMFAEIDPELAAEHGIEDGGWMVIETPRAEIEARAQVTERMRPLKVGGRRVHQVALPWHWGSGAPGRRATRQRPRRRSPATRTSRSRSPRRSRCNVRAGPRQATTATAKLADVPATERTRPARRAIAPGRIDTSHA